MNLTKEALKDGIVLRRLIKDFKTNQNEENLYRILVCLKDSTVYIPCILSKNDGIGSVEGKEYAFMKVKKEDKEYAGIFTDIQQMSNLNNVYKMEVLFKDLFPILKRNKQPIVLDPFTNSLIVPTSLFIVLDQISSQLED